MSIPALKKARPDSAFVAQTLRVKLKSFLTMLGLRDLRGRIFQIHPHMFRRYAAFQTMPGEIITAPAMATLRVVYSA